MAHDDRDTLTFLKKLLTGEQLSSVTFVQDYLQVDFDGTVFTAYVFPNVILNNISFNLQKDGYRDALCSLLGATVIDISLVESANLTVVFSSDNKLIFTVASDAAEYEKLIITTRDGLEYIWD